MKKSRRKFDSAFKAKVAVEALKERQTLSELAVKFDLHPNQISQWKQEFLENSALVFEQKTKFRYFPTDVSGRHRRACFWFSQQVHRQYNPT